MLKKSKRPLERKENLINFFGIVLFNSNPDGWAYMTPEPLNRNNSKWSEVKILFILGLHLQNVLELWLIKDFYLKNAVLGNFQIKK
jgi:hypothetical protein